MGVTLQPHKSSPPHGKMRPQGVSVIVDPGHPRLTGILVTNPCDDSEHP